MELRERIIEGAIQVFNIRGVKFTMDDVAKNIHVSKKTIYTVFNEKDELFIAMVNYLFDSIKESEQAIIEDDSLSLKDKICRILGVLPDGYRDIDFRQLFLLKDKYPHIYKEVENRLETGWETTISLLEQGMEQGIIRPIKIPLLKMMLEASLEQFFQRDILIKNGYTYSEALEEVVEILIKGILVV